MGRDRGEQATPDLFSTQTVRDGTSSPIGPIPATQATADASSQRHVLPKNLRTAVKHLSDGELDLLHAATLEEMGRRGNYRRPIRPRSRSSRTSKSSSGRQVEPAPALVDARADQCRSGSIQGGYQTEAHCAAVRHIPIRRAQGAGVQRRCVEQSQFVSAPAQDGFGATQDNPAAAHPAEIHLHIYGEYKYGMD